MTESTEPKNLRFRLPEDVKYAWVAMCERKKIGQQDAIQALVDFALAQDDVALSMLLGQTEATDDLIEVVLRRMKGRKRKEPTASAAVGRMRGT